MWWDAWSALTLTSRPASMATQVSKCRLGCAGYRLQIQERERETRLLIYFYLSYRVNTHLDLQYLSSLPLGIVAEVNITFTIHYVRFPILLPYLNSTSLMQPLASAIISVTTLWASNSMTVDVEEVWESLVPLGNRCRVFTTLKRSAMVTFGLQTK